MSPQLFFARIPLPVWPVVIAGDFSEWDCLNKPSLNKMDNARILRKALAGYLQLNRGDVGSLAPSRIVAHQHGAKLYSCINELHRTGQLETDYRGIATALTGCAYEHIIEKRSGAKIRPPIEHAEHLGPTANGLERHPLLQSVSEVAVDGVLACHVSNWCAFHRHAVPLTEVVPGADGSYSVDIVVYREQRIVACVEIGAGGELSAAAYKRRRAYKRQVLANSGIPLHCCDLRGGRRTTEALRCCVEWIQVQLGLERLVDETVVSTVLGHPGITTVPYASIEQHQDWIRRHAVRTFDDYERTRLKQKSLGDEVAARLVPRGSLSEWLRRNSLRWYELAQRAPTGQGSAKARQASNTHEFYESYLETRDAARRLKVRTPAAFQKERIRDPRIPFAPDVRWPVEFKKDGWPGFLGTGARSQDLIGMVASDDARRALRTPHGRWKRAIKSLRADAMRRSGRDRYFRPRRLVKHLVLNGLVAQGSADHVEMRLNEIARRA